MDSKKKARLQALVNLANDAGAAPGEAENAARAACRLVAEVGLGALTSGGASPSEDLQRTITVLRRANVDLEVKVRALEAELERVRKIGKAEGGKDGGEMVRWVRLTNKYQAACRGCHQTIPVGATVMWKRGVGVAHEGCTSKVSS